MLMPTQCCINLIIFGGFAIFLVLGARLLLVWILMHFLTNAASSSLLFHLLQVCVSVSAHCKIEMLLGHACNSWNGITMCCFIKSPCYRILQTQVCTNIKYKQQQIKAWVDTEIGPITPIRRAELETEACLPNTPHIKQNSRLVLVVWPGYQNLSGMDTVLLSVSIVSVWLSPVWSELFR